MKAIIRRGTELVEDDLAEPVPGEGQALVSTLVCGICGSDLHALHYLDHMIGLTRRAGGMETLDPAKDVVFGHEFCAEVLDYGPGCAGTLKPGTRVVSVPAAFGPQGSELVGYSNLYPGGFAERMVLQEALLLPVPNGLDAERAFQLAHFEQLPAVGRKHFDFERNSFSADTYMRELIGGEMQTVLVNFCCRDFSFDGLIQFKP